MISIDLGGKVALITGGGQGLGEHMVRTLHAAGATMAINYFADTAGLNRQRADGVAAELGARAAVFEADVRQWDQVERMVQEVGQRFGRLDIVVNNAGILRDKTIKNMPLDWWHAVITTNLTGVFHVCKAAAGVLADGGRIVNVSSIAAVLGFFGQSNYAAAKVGVIGLTKVLSRELAKRRITVNAVAPGVVLTETVQRSAAEVRAEMFKQIPLGRFGKPCEVSDVALFLCSDLASYVTGQTIHVNGGWYG